jgi:hypothetical protein
MPTKWTNQLSAAQLELLLLVADRPERAMRLQLLTNRCKDGIVVPYASEGRTAKALVDRGLVRWVWAQKDKVSSNGITLTQEGADTLVPPAKVTWPEQPVPATLRVNLPGRANVEVLRADYVKAKTAQLREFGYDELTRDHVDAQVTALLAGKKTLDEGLTVIGKMMEKEVIVP